MAWVKLDDGFTSHPKSLAAGPQALALFVSSLCWTSKHLTDGYIPKTALPALLAEAGVKRGSVDRLTSVGYWHERADGYEINGYLERNPSRAQVLAEREANRARVERFRNKPGNAITHGVSNGVSTDPPSRPVPSRPNPPPISEILASLPPLAPAQEDEGRG